MYVVMIGGLFCDSYVFWCSNISKVICGLPVCLSVRQQIATYFRIQLHVSSALIAVVQSQICLVET
jgi:hypothetical protein